MYTLETLEHDSCGIGAVVSIEGVATHKTVDDALRIVEKLEHRAGKDAAGETGDGVGILFQISHRFFSKTAAAMGLSLGSQGDYAVGMFFLPEAALPRNQAKKRLEVIARKEGLEVLGWRDVPTRPEILGEKARSCMPYIAQCFVRRPADAAPGLDFDRRLYHYYATMMEPWDGPASIVFSDGDLVGALLDRNGLRPSRYYVTRDTWSTWPPPTPRWGGKFSAT